MNAVFRWTLACVLVAGLTGCTQVRMYHKVRWTGEIPTYPERDCIEPVLKGLPGVTRVDWWGKQAMHLADPRYSAKEDGYSWSGAKGDPGLGIRVVQPLQRPRVLFEMQYFREEQPQWTAFGNALIAKIADSCKIPDLAQHIKYEHIEEPHLVPFWAN